MWTSQRKMYKELTAHRKHLTSFATSDYGAQLKKTDNTERRQKCVATAALLHYWQDWTNGTTTWGKGLAISYKIKQTSTQ